jgi:hypothetical protein
VNTTVKKYIEMALREHLVGLYPKSPELVEKLFEVNMTHHNICEAVGYNILMRAIELAAEGKK